MAKELASGIVRKTSGNNIDPTRVVKRAEWNTRFDFGDVESLANSIEEELKRDPSSGGLLMPIRVKRITGVDGADFEIVDGERRMTAIALLLERGVVFPEGVSAKIVERTQSDTVSLIQMYTANTGKPMLPLEAAAAFKRMKDGGEGEAGLTVQQIAKAVGRTEVFVLETLSLLEADASLQDALQGGEIGATAAKVIANVAGKDKELQADLVADAKAAKGTGKAAKEAKARLQAKLRAKQEAKAAAKGKTLKMRALTDEQLSALGASVAKMLDTKSKEAGFKFETIEEYVAFLAKDGKLAAAFTLGAMLALHAAAGMKTNLDI